MRLSYYKMNKFTAVILLTAIAAVLTGCNHLPRGKAPKMNAVFDRFEKVQIGKSTSADVFSFIQNKDMDEMLCQDEQTVVSWGQNGTGAVIWFNAVSFDQTNDQAARKYAMLIDEDSPGWHALHLAKSRKLRADFEYVLPAEFDELEFTNENEKRREALKTAVSLYLKDINVVRFDSDYIYMSAMLLRQTFNELLYELEKVPTYLSVIDRREGVEFTHPTMGAGRVRMLMNTDTYTVRLKIVVGTVVKGFAKDDEVIAMESFLPDAQKTALAAGDTEKQKQDDKTAVQEKKGWFNWLGGSKKQPAKPKYRSPEELQKIEEMARQKAQAEIEAMEKTAAQQGDKKEPADEKADAEKAVEQEQAPAEKTETGDVENLPLIIPTQPQTPQEPEQPQDPQQPVMQEAIEAQTNP